MPKFYLNLEIKLGGTKKGLRIFILVGVLVKEIRFVWIKAIVMQINQVLNKLPKTQSFLVIISPSAFYQIFVTAYWIRH